MPVSTLPENGVLDMAMMPKEPTAELVALPAHPALDMFERLARDPNVPVDKLERMVDLQQRILAHEAKAAFNAAFAKMQSELPEIQENGRIVVKGTLRSTYAKLEDIHAAVKPILKAHGFAIRHRTEWPEKPGTIRIVGILSHELGHAEESVFEAPADASDFRSDIQSMGSTVSYGRRYTTLDLLNIATRGADNDGQGKPVVPDGYEDWFKKLEAAAAKGAGALQAEFSKGAPALKEHLANAERQAWGDLKQRAMKVGK